MGGALQVSKYPFDQLHMSVTRLVHEEANLLDGIGDIRASEGEILKHAGQAPVVGGVGERLTIV